MTDEDKVEEPPVNYGPLIYEELKMMNRILGAISQKITSDLGTIKYDLEVAKNHLGKLKKMSASEVTINDQRTPPSAPQTQGPIGGSQ